MANQFPPLRQTRQTPERGARLWHCSPIVSELFGRKGSWWRRERASERERESERGAREEASKGLQMEEKILVMSLFSV